jgi:hypothetical protein
VIKIKKKLLLSGWDAFKRLPKEPFKNGCILCLSQTELEAVSDSMLLSMMILTYANNI